MEYVLERRIFFKAFGNGPAQDFWEAFDKFAVDHWTANVIKLEDYSIASLPEFARSLAGAFEILITEGAGVRTDHSRSDDFSKARREPFYNSPYRAVHGALFDLSKQFPNVWVEGDREGYKIKVSTRITSVASASLSVLAFRALLA